MVEYAYAEDTYYKRCKLSMLISDSNVTLLMIVPHRDDHMKALEKLKTQAKAKLITAPLFPYTGSVFFVMS